MWLHKLQRGALDAWYVSSNVFIPHFGPSESESSMLLYSSFAEDVSDSLGTLQKELQSTM